MRWKVIQLKDYFFIRILFSDQFKKFTDIFFPRSFFEVNNTITVQRIKSKCIGSQFSSVLFLFWFSKCPQPLCISFILRRTLIEKTNYKIFFIFIFQFFRQFFLVFLLHHLAVYNPVDTVFHDSFQSSLEFSKHVSLYNLRRIHLRSNFLLLRSSS